MKRWLMTPAAVLGLLSAIPDGHGQDIMETIAEHLTFSSPDLVVRSRLSGTVDLEYYQFERPAPSLIYTGGDRLFNPRLSLYFDLQMGAHWYAFAQARVDRGYDPADEPLQVRMDEYAIRYSPTEDGTFSVQVGKFATVAGRWVARHASWDNPFVGAPLAYELVTVVYDGEVPATAADFVHPIDPEEKYEYVPAIWGASYASGVVVAGRLGDFEYAGEIKNAGLASRPDAWDLTQVSMDYPSYTARIGWRPTEMWNLGISASRGPYLLEKVAPDLPAGRGIGDYEQMVFGQDLSFEWHHFQFWAEAWQVRFEVPRVGDAELFSYFLEVRYKFGPQWFGAVRWNHQMFGDVTDGHGGMRPWGGEVVRLDLAATWRITEFTQIKLQYSLQHEGDEAGARGGGSQAVAAQWTLRF